MFHSRSASRREFLIASGVTVTSLVLPFRVRAALRSVDEPVTIGMIADLHQDVMHDGPERMKAFLDAMKKEKPDALVQLGDFAYPNEKNRPVSDAFEKAHPKAFHVLGNHDIDEGHSFEKVAELWKMKGRYYTEKVGGLDLLVLDCNEKPEGHSGGYPAHVGEEQMKWIEQQLGELEGPILVLSHQPLAGPSCIDNAAEVQALLDAAAEKVLLAVNGHTHIDHLARAGKIPSLHVNSASYKWVGGSHRHPSYAAEIHESFPYIEYTCPYRDSLFTTLRIDPAAGRIDVKGRESEWVGPPPSKLGIPDEPDLVDGEQVCAKIRTRRIPTKGS